MVFFTTKESEEPTAKWSRVMQSCYAIRISIEIETKQTRYNRSMKRSLLIHPISNKQILEVSVFVHCTVRFVLIMAF